MCSWRIYAKRQITGSGHIPLPRTPPKTPPRKDKKIKEKRSRLRDKESRRGSDHTEVPPLPGQEPSSGTGVHRAPVEAAQVSKRDT